MIPLDEKKEPIPDHQKANDIAIEALKQLLTLASVILALTITLIKDALGESRAAAQLQWLVPLAWILLIFSIWMAWVAIADAARRIGTLADTKYAFAKTSPTWKYAKAAQLGFTLGLSLLGLFGILNFNLFFHSHPPREEKCCESTAICRPASSPAPQPVPKINPTPQKPASVPAKS
jgi:hypothetical protein